MGPPRFAKLAFAARWEKDFRALPREVRDKTARMLERFLADPTHPGLRCKPILPHKIYWEVRIDRTHRAVFRPDGDTARFLAAGPHKLVGSFGRRSR